MPSQKPKMGILFLNLLWMMGEGMADCAKKMEFIGSCGCVCPHIEGPFTDPLRFEILVGKLDGSVSTNVVSR